MGGGGGVKQKNNDPIIPENLHPRICILLLQIPILITRHVNKLNQQHLVEICGYNGRVMTLRERRGLLHVYNIYNISYFPP